MRILGLESSCDETAAAVVEDGRTLLSSVVASQVELHKLYGGVVLPSFLIIFGISFVLRAFQSVRLVQYAFNGIRAGVLALILKALWSMYRQCPKSAVSYVVMAAAFLLTAFLSINVLFVILGCAAFGLLTAAVTAKRNRR